MRSLHVVLWTGLFVAGLAASAAGGPLEPQIDFRNADYSEANNNEAYSGEVDGVGFTVRAWRETSDSEREAAELWQDGEDGLGILGTEDDEIDIGESLEITFDETIGLSHIFLADLFSNETRDGETYSESGRLTTDGGFETVFTGADLTGSWGDSGNGEAVLALDKTIPVNSFSLTVASGIGFQNFALLGFIDPPLSLATADVVSIPAPGSFALMLLGLGGAVFFRRRV